jgi:outer membrane protein assembly factor BamD
MNQELKQGPPLRPPPFHVLVFLGVLVLAGCAGTQKTPPTDDVGRIEQARTLFEAERYKDVILELQAFLAARPGSRFVEEANYLIGRAYYERGLDFDAEDQFHKVLREFPGGEFAAECTYYLGLALLSQSRSPHHDQTETEAALRQFRTFTVQYPDHEWVERAKGHVLTIRNKLAHKIYLSAEVYRQRGYRYPERLYYQKITDQFPNTEWVAPAMLGLAKNYKKSKAWKDVAEWAGKLIEAHPAYEKIGEARDLLKEAEKHTVPEEDKGAVTEVEATTDSSQGPR